ncbi:MAG: AMIN domain-containing protein [Gemmatimonadaceae bacterium]|jgi:type IV pilus assembly protein PilQ|nr:AMIN domain-containing protein [Gemmatimonadaceae bacterium]
MMGPFHVAALSAALSLSVGAFVPAPAAAIDANGIVIVADDVLARVTGIAVAHVAGKAELRIATESGVEVREFRLDGPDRLVVDITGARLTTPARAYDGVARGAIRNIRLSQYRTDVVRVVVDLDGRRAYEISRSGTMITIGVEGASAAFATWEMGSLAPMVAEQAPAKSAPEEARVVPETPAPAPRQAETVREARNAALDFGDTQKTERLDLTRGERMQPRRQERPRITVTYQDADIRDVIAAFAAFSGRTIVVGKEVTGAITAEIKDKPWDVALQAILQSQGLAATEDPSGILTVDSFRNLASNQALEPLVTRIVDINYQKANALVATVQQLLARDCSNLTTGQAAMGAAGGMGMGGMGMQPGMGGMGQQPGQQGGMGGAGCVIRGSVVADSATNKLLVTDAPSRLDEIIAKVQELDMRTPQVAIKAKIIFVNRTGIQDIGIAYDLGTGTKQFFSQLVPRNDPETLRPVDTNGDGVNDALGGGTPFLAPARIAVGGNAVSAIANANNAIKPDALNLIYSMTLGKYQLTTFVNALQRTSLADVQSEPSTVTLNNRTAEIFVGQEIPIRVIDASAGGAPGAGGGGGGGAGGAGGAGGQTPNAAAFFPRSTVQLKEAGIRLSVTPQITLNRMIMLNLKAENSSAEIGPSDVGFVFNQQRANTQVLVADGETAVIGGLTVTEVSRSRQGIPVLMNLPIIGRLFAQNTRSETKRDLLVLVTPHILDETASVPPGR